MHLKPAEGGVMHCKSRTLHRQGGLVADTLRNVLSTYPGFSKYLLYQANRESCHNAYNSDKVDAAS